MPFFVPLVIQKPEDAPWLLLQNSLWLFPAEGRLRRRNLGTQAHTTLAEHGVDTLCFKDQAGAFYPKYIEQHLPINKQLIKGAAECEGPSSAALDLVSLLHFVPRGRGVRESTGTEGGASRVFSASTSHCFQR